MSKIGFLENANGEKSHTKLINIIVSLCIMVGWAIVSGLQHKLVEIPPTLLGVLFFCMGINSLNKKLESGNLIDKVKRARNVLVEKTDKAEKIVL